MTAPADPPRDLLGALQDSIDQARADRTTRADRADPRPGQDTGLSDDERRELREYVAGQVRPGLTAAVERLVADRVAAARAEERAKVAAEMRDA